MTLMRLNNTSIDIWLPYDPHHNDSHDHILMTHFDDHAISTITDFSSYPRFPTTALYAWLSSSSSLMRLALLVAFLSTSFSF